MAILGELEQQVMEVLWQQDRPASVRQVHEQLDTGRELAYTTVMTVLDRLAKKSLTLRQRDGRAWLYSSAVSRAELVGDALAEVLDQAGDQRGGAVRHFVTGLDEPTREQLRRLLG